MCVCVCSSKLFSLVIHVCPCGFRSDQTRLCYNLRIMGLEETDFSFEIYQKKLCYYVTAYSIITKLYLIIRIKGLNRV